MRKLFGTDGIRGLVDKELDANIAYRVGSALTDMLIDQGIVRPGILVGMDTRESSPMLLSALTDGIRSSGGRAINLGVCSTPAVAYHVVKSSFDAGVMISASHNPYRYNGIKIFGRNGIKLSDNAEDEIEKNVLAEKPTSELARNEYIEYLKGIFPASLDGLKIGIDCANGSASVTAKELFTALGAECHMLSDNPDGKNINEECGSTHLASLKKLVLSHNLDAGIAFDGDADRCIAIDENGCEIDGDYIIAILALRMKKDGTLNENTIVGTVMSNLGLRKFCEEQGIIFKSAPVGDRFVLEMLNENGYSLGGEQSGHIILPGLATTGDGQLTALALLSEMKKSGKSLGELSSIMKKYPQITINIDADAIDKKHFIEDTTIADIISEELDKIKDNGRIIIRPSGTEPFIRISVEKENPVDAELISRRLADKIKGRLKELKTSVR